MFRRLALPGALLLAFVAAHPALAQTADTTVGFLGFYQAAEPYLVSLFVAVVMAALTIIWQQLRARLKILQTQQAADVEAKAASAFQTALTNAAGRYLAGQEGNVASLKVDVHSPGIASEVSKVQAMVPDAIGRLNISPERVETVIADGIVGKVGQLQAVASASTPAVVSGPNADTAVVITPTAPVASPPAAGVAGPA